MKFNLPNALTWFRVVAIPLVVLVFYGPELFGWDESWARPAAGLLFGLAGITDYFDGYLARMAEGARVVGLLRAPVPSGSRARSSLSPSARPVTRPA